MLKIKTIGNLLWDLGKTDTNNKNYESQIVVKFVAKSHTYLAYSSFIVEHSRNSVSFIYPSNYKNTESQLGHKENYRNPPMQQLLFLCSLITM